MKRGKIFRKLAALITCLSLLIVFSLPASAVVEVEPAIAKADIFILIDKTKSMKQELTYAKTETIDFIQELQDNNVDCRVGIATFGSHASLNSNAGGAKNWTGFQDISNEEDVDTKLTNMIDSLALHGYIEQTTKAINQAADKLNEEARSDAGKILIIITDSPALAQNEGDYSRTKIAGRLKDKGINTFFIGEAITPDNDKSNEVLIVRTLANILTQLTGNLRNAVQNGNVSNPKSFFNALEGAIASINATDEHEDTQVLMARLFRLFNEGTLTGNVFTGHNVSDGMTYEDTYNEILAELNSEDSLLYGLLYDIDDESQGSRFLASGGLGKGIAPAYAQILELLKRHYLYTRPLIDSFTCTPQSFKPDEFATITATVHDLDIESDGTGDTLTYALQIQKPNGSTEDIALTDEEIEAIKTGASDVTFTIGDETFNTKQFTISKQVSYSDIGEYKATFTVHDSMGARATDETTFAVSNLSPIALTEMTDKVTAATTGLSDEQNKYLPGSDVIMKAVFKTTENDDIGSYDVKFDANASGNTKLQVSDIKVIGYKIGPNDDTEIPIQYLAVPADVGPDTVYTVTGPDANEVTLYFKYKFNKVNSDPILLPSQLKLNNKITIVAKKGEESTSAVFTKSIGVRDANIKIQ